MPSDRPNIAHAAPNSLRALLSEYTALRDDGRSFAVASVVRVEGSAFRREGARLLVVPIPDTDLASIADDSHAWEQVSRPHTLGSISGGCLEGEVAWQTLDAIRSGQAWTVALTSRLGDDDRAAFGFGCGGTVTVLVQPVRPDDVGPLDAVARALDDRRTGALAVVVGGSDAHVGQHLFVHADGWAEGNVEDAELRDALVSQAVDALSNGAGRDAVVCSGAVEARIDVIRPPLSVVVFGTGPDARALVRQATLLGWETKAVGAGSTQQIAAAIPEADHAVVVSNLSDASNLADDRTAAVVMTHNFERDRALVATLADSAAPYLGLLGSRRRTARLVADLADQGVALPTGRLHFPVGLDLGSETPEEIALATCAEILSHSQSWATAESPQVVHRAVASLS